MSRRPITDGLSVAAIDSHAPIAVIPTLSVMIASLVTALPIMVDAPLLPPFGFLVLIAWRLMRSDIWPVWIGIPLGFWDDLFSGQPVGSAVALWTIAMLAMELIDARLVWRDYWIDWLIGAVVIAFVLATGAMLARTADLPGIAILVAPQLAVSLFALPAMMLLVARLDRWRIGQ